MKAGLTMAPVLLIDSTHSALLLALSAHHRSAHLKSISAVADPWHGSMAACSFQHLSQRGHNAAAHVRPGRAASPQTARPVRWPAARRPCACTAPPRRPAAAPAGCNPARTCRACARGSQRRHPPRMFRCCSHCNRSSVSARALLTTHSVTRLMTCTGVRRPGHFCRLPHRPRLEGCA